MFYLNLDLKNTWYQKNSSKNISAVKTKNEKKITIDPCIIQLLADCPFIQCSKKIQHYFFSYGETPPFVLVSGGEALKTTTRAVCRALIDCTDRSYNGFLCDSGEPFSGKFMKTTCCVPSPRESYGCLMDKINATTIRSWGDLINI